MLESLSFSSLLSGREGGDGSPRGITLSTGVCLVVALALAPLFGLALALENRIFLAALVMVALIPAVIRWPILSTFGLYVFLVPFDSVATLSESGGATLTRLVGIAAGGVLLVAGLIERRLVRPPSAALWWSLFLVWAGLSMAWAIQPYLVRGRLPTAASLFLLYLIAVSIKPTRTELYGVCLLVVAGGMAAAATGYFFGVEDVRGARATLVMGEQASNPNTLGSVLILPLALAVGGFAGLRNPIQKLLTVGALGIIGIGIFITQSRGALLAIVVTILVFVYRAKVRWQVLVPVGMLLGLVMVLPQTFFARAEKVFTGQDTTGAGRTEIWSFGLEALEHVGVFGAGFGNYTEIYQFSDAYSPGAWAKGAHNTYLGTWVELGIVGLVLMLAALASHFLAARAVRRTGLEGLLLSAIEAACVGVLAGAFFADRFGSKSFWVPFILLTWAIRNVRDSQQGPGSPS
jgi:O-antigen ligase